MVSKRGDLALLETPLAEALLRGTIPARLAYVWTDGTPRVIPTGFHWTGEEIVLGTPVDAPKVKALRQNPHVALTIDTESFPAQVLLIRGTATVTVVHGVVPEYVEAGRHALAASRSSHSAACSGPGSARSSCWSACAAAR